jgi:hypothetical protein
VLRPQFIYAGYRKQKIEKTRSYCGPYGGARNGVAAALDDLELITGLSSVLPAG